MLIEVTETFCVSNIRLLRKKYSISRRGLAKLIGISHNILKLIEEEETWTIFKESELKRICDIFEIPMEDLIHKDLSK